MHGLHQLQLRIDLVHYQPDDQRELDRQPARGAGLEIPRVPDYHGQPRPPGDHHGRVDDDAVDAVFGGRIFLVQYLSLNAVAGRFGAVAVERSDRVRLGVINQYAAQVEEPREPGYETYDVQRLGDQDDIHRPKVVGLSVSHRSSIKGHVKSEPPGARGVLWRTLCASANHLPF